MKEKGEKVEKWKTTQDEKGFSKQLKKVLMVERMLKATALKKVQELKGIQDLYMQFTQKKKQLMQMAPESPTFETPGMNFQEEDQQAPQQGMSGGVQNMDGMR